MTYHLVVTPAASDDIDAAMNWYDEQEEDLGNRFIVAVQSRFDDILQSPLFPRLLSVSSIRRIHLIHWPYFIYYRIKNETIRIIAVIHTSRDPKFISSRIR